MNPTILDKTVLGIYDLGLLTKEILIALINPYQSQDLKIFGHNWLRAKDGKTVHEIIIETWGLELPALPEDSHDEDQWAIYYRDNYQKMDIIMQYFNSSFNATLG